MTQFNSVPHVVGNTHTRPVKLKVVNPSNPNSWLCKHNKHKKVPFDYGYYCSRCGKLMPTALENIPWVLLP